MDWLILFLSGVIGGVLNSIAGGGSFITFPALLFAGVPPIAANATNTFASCAGYISGAYALRHEIQSGTKQLKLTIAWAMCNWRRHWCISYYYTRQKRYLPNPYLGYYCSPLYFLPLVAHSING